MVLHMKSYRPNIFAVVLLLLLSAVAARAGIYSNEEFDFSFDCPEDYSLRKSSDIYFSVRGRDGRTVLDGVVESLSAYPRSLYDGLKDPARDFGTHRAMLRCDADGPDGSAHCPSIAYEKEFRTQNGIRAIELYLNHMQETFGEETEKTESVVGPVYILDISGQGNTAVLIIGAAPYKRMDAEQRALAEYIVESVMLK